MKSSGLDVEQAIESLADPALGTVVATHVRRLRTVLEQRPVDQPMALCGIWGRSDADPAIEPERCIEQQIISLAQRKERLMNTRVFVPGICGISFHGVHFMDALMEGDVFDLDGKGNWQVRPFAKPVGSLKPPDTDAYPEWEKAKRAARCFVDSGISNVFLNTPCLSSPLNIAINLYGQEFLLALYEEPGAAHHDLRIITDLMLMLHRWYLEHVPVASLQAVAAATRFRPPGYGHLCGCSCQLISADQYREFIMPYEEEVLSLYPHGGMIHLCGIHTQHIPVWRNMKTVRMLQLNDRASADLPAYFRGLRPDQVIYNLECPEMPWQQAAEFSGGRRIVHTHVTTEGWAI